MTQKPSYLEQANEYYRQQEWRQRLMAARVPRGLVVKAGTLAALGGASAISQLLAACAGGGAQKDALVGTSAEGAYKWSKYPMIEKYNWRNMPWGGTPYIDGTLVMPGDGSENWDFVHRANNSSGFVMDNLMNKRYGAGADMEMDVIEGHLADRWSHAPDYSYFDYHIRPGVYFHDIEPVNGRLCTAEDVKYCLDVHRTIGLNRSAVAFIDRIELLPDKETVRVFNKRPVLFSDVTLASSDFYIFAREHFEGPKDRWEQQPIGIGPFKMTYQKVGDKMEMVRHERFGRGDSRWQGYQLPFLKAHNLFVLPTGIGSKAALRSGQVDFASVTDYVDLQDLIATSPELIIQIYAPNTTYGGEWALNLRDPALADVRVRRALSLALNRHEMIDTVVGGMGSGGHPLTYTWLGRTDPFDPDELGPWQQYDPGKAKALLAEAGYANGFELDFMITGAPTSSHVMTEQYFQQIGVRLNFNQVETVVLTAARLNRTFKQAINGGYGSTGYDPLKIAAEMYLPNSPKNYSGVDDPLLTSLVDKAIYTVDADEQRRLLYEIHERHLDQIYQLEFYVPFTVHVRQPWLHNVASAVQGYFNAYGWHQVAVAWIDDTAPEGRKGRLKA